MESLLGTMPSMDWHSSDLEGSWKSFKQHAEFMFSGPLKEISEPQKCSYLMIWIGEKGRNIYSTWTLTGKESEELKTYYERFEQYVKPRTNIIYNRYKFHSRIQKENETFDQFVTEVQLLVKDCNFKETDDMVRDRLVIGIRNSKIREKLINIGSELTLEKTLEIARLHELSAAQAKSMSGEDYKVNTIQKGSSQRRHGQVNRQTNYTGQGQGKPRKQKQHKHSNDTNKLNKSKCTKCGYEHGKYVTCPAQGQTCKKCGKQNHFWKLCRTKSVNVVNVDNCSENNSDSDDFLFLGSIDLNVNSVNTSKWTQDLTIDDMQVNFNIDTGAMCNVISLATIKLVERERELKPSLAPLKSYSGHKMTTNGTITLPCKLGSNMYSVIFHVVDKDVKPVLGADTCEHMGLVKRVHRVDPIEIEKCPSDNIPPDIQKEYGDIFTGLGCLPGKHSIKIDTDVTPIIHAPRKVPLALKNKLKTELNRMERLGVIIKQDKPTSWVNSMVTVVKPNGKLRICIDPKDLNKAICREHYPLKTIEEITAEMTNAKVFTKLDAVSGFWQIALDDESTKLCTFNSPFGRYSFTRLPFGVKSASEVYQKKVADMVQDLEGCESIIDDILIWGKDREQHDIRLKRVMDRIRENNMKLSSEKCEFRKSSITYVGHTLTDKGLQPDIEKVRAVQNMKPPTNKQEVQTFMGFITYLGKFLPNLSEVSAPLRSLTEKDVHWHWDAEQESSFQKLKLLVTESPILRYYDPNKPLTLTVDASSTGLGAALVQEGQPIAYASRALTKSQKNYAQIEKETLAISFGCAKFHQYIYGRHVLVESDHKPLQSIFVKPLYKAPQRLQNLLLSLQKYDIEVKYKPGKTMFLADALSRNYLDETREELAPNLLINQISYLPVSPEKYRDIQQATSNDEELVTLQDIVQSGWPDTKEHIPACIRTYWPYRDEISTIDGLLFKGHKLIIPRSMRRDMLNIIHSSHLGISKCKSRAREIIHWPGMSSDIEDFVSKCSTCAINQRQNSKEPLLETETPSRPWSIVSSDILEFKGKNYLLTVDHYSKWPELACLDNMTSSCSVNHLKSQFARFGIPDKVITDNGSQFACANFNDFAIQYGFCHVTTSPHFPQANGQVERMVQTVKNMLKKADDPYKALLAYRNTPIDDIGMSPAQLFLGRRLKTDLPTTTPLLDTNNSSFKEVQMRLKTRKMMRNVNADIHCGKELRNLYKGEKVIMRHNNEWTPAIVHEKTSAPKSYVLQNSNGKKFRRNRRHIRPTNANIPTDTKPAMEAIENNILPTKPVENSVPQPTSENVNETVNKTNSNSPVKTRSGRIISPPLKLQEYVT